MKKILITNFNEQFSNIEPNVCCFGFFDGIHWAHQKLIKCAAEIAEKNKSKLSIFSINKNVGDFFNNSYTQLMPNNLKEEFFESMNIDYYFEMEVNEITLNTNKNLFLNFIKKNLNLIKIVVGEDFTFGKNRAGTPLDLLNYFGDENVYTLALVTDQNRKKISSTLIREFLISNQLELANKLLISPYTIEEMVAHGKGEGNKIGFPTINQYFKWKLLVPEGTYITETRYLNVWYPSISCYYKKFDQFILETHILDFNEYLYNKNIYVRFLKFLRFNIKTINYLELKNIINNDKNKALEFFKYKL